MKVHFFFRQRVCVFYLSGLKIWFQSFFILITVQPFAFASS